MKNSVDAALFALVASFASAALHAEILSRYALVSVEVSKLDPLSDVDSEAYDINDAGRIVGTMKPAALKRRGFLFRNGELIDVVSKPEATSSANAINASDVVVGSWDIDGDLHAYRWAAGELVTLKDKDTSLHPDPATNSSAAAISDTGVIAGIRASRQTHDWFATVWTSDETFKSINGSGPQTSAARDINDAGLVVGSIDTPSIHVFMKAWQMSPTVDSAIDVPALATCASGKPADSGVYGVNRGGEVVGYQNCPRPDGERVNRAFYWNGSDKRATDLGGPAYTWAWDINDAGFIVGEASVIRPGKWTSNSGFIYHRDFGMILLPKLRETKDFEDCSAQALNNLNGGRIQVVGKCMTSAGNGDFRAVTWDVKISKLTTAAARAPALPGVR